MHTFDFKNRTAVVTGGAQGFGLDVAKRFLESGAKVFIWDIDEKLLKSAVDEVKNPNLFYSVVDISNYQDVEKNVADITSKTNIDILINNAGITHKPKKMEAVTVKEFDKVFNVNAKSVYYCGKYFVPKMKKIKTTEIKKKVIVLSKRSICKKLRLSLELNRNSTPSTKALDTIDIKIPKLIPVIKNRTVEEVKEVYNCGFREFGENRLDDYFLHSDKFDDAVFHFIAPIQSRKIKVIFENFVV